MNPLSLRATSYRTYADLALDFPDGVCAITGELADQPGKSNGSGKSSIANAIDLCLFGAQSRSLADEHNPAFGDTMTLELVFDHAGETYRIRRTYNAKGRGSTTVDLDRKRVEFAIVPGFGDREDDEAPVHFWEPLTRESAAATQEHLEQILGLSRPTFRASSFLAQGDGAAFTSAQPRERKRILGEVLGLGVWPDLLERARADKRTADLRVADLTGLIARAEPELAQRDVLGRELAEARETARAARDALESALSRLATARDALAEARRRVESGAGAEKAVQSAEREFSELRARIEAQAAALLALDARLATRSELQRLVSAHGRLEEERERIRAALAQWDRRVLLEADLAAIDRRIANADEAADALRAKAVLALANEAEPCDRCHRPLDNESALTASASYEAEAAEIVRGMNDDGERAATIRSELADLPHTEPNRDRMVVLHGEIQRAQNAAQQLAALTEAQTRRDELAQEIDKMRAELPEREEAIAAARAQLAALGPHDPDETGRLQREVARLETDEAADRATIGRAEQTIARLDERLARLDALAAEVQAATADRDTCRDELELLAALERAYGPNGIPAYIIESTAIPQIEAEACRVLRELGTDYQVELHTQRVTKAGGVADALDIVVYDGIRARPYEGFSGGEKTRIDLALRIALAHLLANRRGAESKLLVIDEPAGLDASGMAALADVLRRLYADGVFAKVLIVSHVAELRDSFEASIHVVCENGVSRLSEARDPVTA